MKEKVYFHVEFDRNGNQSIKKTVEKVKLPHLYPLGSLVEILKDEDDLMEELGFGSMTAKYVGMRLFIVNHFYNDGGEPMYVLSTNLNSQDNKKKAEKALNDSSMIYGSKEYIQKTQDYFLAYGSQVTDIKESMLKLIK